MRLLVGDFIVFIGSIIFGIFSTQCLFTNPVFASVDISAGAEHPVEDHEDSKHEVIPTESVQGAKFSSVYHI